MTDPCGDSPTGVRGCRQPEAVYIEFTDTAGNDMAAVLCQEHAARLRAGGDIWDEVGYVPFPYTVTKWRSA